MRIRFLIVCFMALGISLYAATSETESNDTVNDANVIIINTLGEYTGSVNADGGGGGSDIDYWKFAAGTSALDFNLSETPVDVSFLLFEYSDAEYSSGSIHNSLSGGTDPAPESGIDSEKYYALLVAAESEGLWDYSFEVEEGSSLPVELASFSVRETAKGILLEWVTESELDNLGYILERSLDGNAWRTIASYETEDALKSPGNTSMRTQYAYNDADAAAGLTYFYRLSDVNSSGEVHSYPVISIRCMELPGETVMEKAYPNPFNPVTYIDYRLAMDEKVGIDVFDMQGRHVRTIYERCQSAGRYHVYWNGVDDNGRSVPSGSYVIRMRTQTRTQVQKVILLK